MQTAFKIQIALKSLMILWVAVMVVHGFGQTAPLVISRPKAQPATYHRPGVETTAKVGQAFTYTPTMPAGAKCTEAALTLGNPHAASQRAAATPTKAAVAKHPQRKPLTQLSQQSAFSYNATSGAITGMATRRGMAGFVFTCTLPTGQKRKIPVLIRAR